MPLPDLSTFCTTTPVRISLAITLPGGAELTAIFANARPPNPDELAGALIDKANTALAPLAPFFDVLNVIVALVNCVKAVEKCLGPPPSPAELIKCFPALAAALAKLLELLPVLTVPILIGEILDAIIAFLEGLQLQILAVIAKSLKITLAASTASKLGSVQLQVAADCAQADLDAFIANLTSNAAPLAQLINLVNALLDLAGLPHIPCLVGLDFSANLSITPLVIAIKLLKGIRIGFPPAAGPSACAA